MDVSGVKYIHDVLEKNVGDTAQAIALGYKDGGHLNKQLKGQFEKLGANKVGPGHEAANVGD
jgi:hypothetical protein